MTLPAQPEVPVSADVPTYVAIVVEDATDAQVLRDCGLPGFLLEQAGQVPVGRVLLLGRCRRFAGDLQQRGCETYGADVPLPARTVIEFLADSENRQGRPLDHDERQALLLEVAFWSARPVTSQPTGHGGLVARTALAGPLEPIGMAELDRMPEPRRYLLRHPDRAGVTVDDGQGDGMLPLGKTAVFSSAGGVGKTRSVVEMAVAILTGRRWLDHYVVGPEVRGDVLLVLAEDDPDDAQRAVWRTIEAMRLSEAEREQVAQGLVVRGLAGKDVRLAAGEDGDYRPTAAHGDLLRALQGRQWALVVLDPLTRFAGVATDRDTDAGTYVVQLAEQIVVASGGATVMFTAHSSKNSRSQGGADVRGVVSVVDGVRWVGTLVEDGEDVLFRQVKSNHSRPMPKPLRLVREPGGRLRVQRTDEMGDAADMAQASADAADRDATARILAAAERMGGVATTRNDLCRAARVKAATGRALIDLAVAEGRLLAVPSPGRRVSFYLPGDGPAGGAQSPLYPPGPRDRGAGARVRGPGTARDREGPWDRGTVEGQL